MVIYVCVVVVDDGLCLVVKSLDTVGRPILIYIFAGALLNNVASHN